MEAAYGLFYRIGFLRTGVDAIAAEAGVTKRTLYYHFESKDELLGAVLDEQHQLMLSRINEWSERVSGDPDAIIEMVFARFEDWCRRPGWQGSGFTRAAMELAELPGHPGRQAARRHKRSVEDVLAHLLDSNGVASSKSLARQIMLLVEGSHSLVLIHGDIGYVSAAAEAARSLCRLWSSGPPPK